MEDSITVYSSPTCPKCKMRKMQLKAKGISFNVCEDTQVALSKGIQNLPAMEINGQLLNFPQAIEWIRGRAK